MDWSSALASPTPCLTFAQVAAYRRRVNFSPQLLDSQILGLECRLFPGELAMPSSLGGEAASLQCSGRTRLRPLS